MSLLGDSKVEVSLKALDELRDEAHRSAARIQALEREVVAAKLEDKSGRVPALMVALRAAVEVVQFAVGNLDPTTVRGWPYEALGTIADALEQIPGLQEDPNMRSLAGELRHFAGIAAGLEEFRKERDAKRVVTPATAADFGPKTAEASFIHNALGPRTATDDDEDEEGVSPT